MALRKLLLVFANIPCNVVDNPVVENLKYFTFTGFSSTVAVPTFSKRRSKPYSLVRSLPLAKFCLRRRAHFWRWTVGKTHSIFPCWNHCTSAWKKPAGERMCLPVLEDNLKRGSSSLNSYKTTVAGIVADNAKNMQSALRKAQAEIE